MAIALEQQPVKKIVDQTTIVESAPTKTGGSDDAPENQNISNQVDENAFVDLGQDVAPVDLDWETEEKKEETQTPSPDKGKQAEAEGEKPVDSPPAEELKTPEKKDELTESMKQRVRGIKEKGEAEKSELAGQNSELRGRIETLNVQLEKFRLIKAPSLTGNEDKDAEKLQSEYDELEAKLDDEEQTLTSVDTLKIDRRQREIKKEISNISSDKEKAVSSKEQFLDIRNQADNLMEENYPFMKDRDSEEYKLAVEVVRPMLAKIIPNLSDNPQDMLITAAFTETYHKAQKYDKIMGNKPKVDKDSNQEPFITEEVLPPKIQTSLTKADIINQAKSGKITWGRAAGLIEEL